MTTMTTVLLPPPSLPPPLTSPLTSAAGVEAGARVTDALPMMLLLLLRARVAGATDTLAPVLPVVLAGAVGVVVVVVAVVVVVGHWCETAPGVFPQLDKKPTVTACAAGISHSPKPAASAHACKRLHVSRGLRPPSFIW